MKTVSPQAFNYFRKIVFGEIDRFGLYDYLISVGQAEMGEGWDAACETDIESRVALICLNESLPGEKYTKEDLRQLGVHEVWELLLAELFHMAQGPPVQEADVKAAMHRVIQRVWNCMYQD